MQAKMRQSPQIDAHRVMASLFRENDGLSRGLGVENAKVRLKAIEGSLRLKWQ